MLTPSTYVVTTGQHSGNIANEQDLGVLRWDSSLGTNGDWSESVIPGNANWTATSFEDDPIMGMPVYSPVDGVVISCWAEMPDDTVVGGNCPGGTSACMKAGNHVTILTDNGNHIVFLGHLGDSTIPTSVCPITTEFVYGDPTSCPGTLGTSGWTRLKAETVLGLPLPVVRKGDYLGDVGFSGATSDPHLHMHVKQFQYSGSTPCVSPAEPMDFDEAWSQLLADETLPTDGDWVRLDGSAPPPYSSPSFTAIWPEPSGIQFDVEAVAAATIPAVAITDDSTLGTEGVVAHRASTGDLKVTSFDFSDSAGIASVNTATEAAADRIGVARIGDNAKSVVVAIRNESTFKLQLLPYNIQSNHTLDKGGVLTSTNTIGDVAITRSPVHAGVVVASIDSGTSDVKVKDYSAAVTSTDITLTGHGSDTSTENTLNVDVATVFAGRAIGESPSLSPFVGVVTAERRANGDAYLRTWAINSSGSSVTLADDIQLFSETSGLAFSVSDIDVSVVGDPDERQFAVVSLRHSNNNLYVQTYEIAIDGTLTRKDQWTAGTIDMLASTDAGEYDVVVGVRTSGLLSLLSFSVDGDGILGRTGTRDLAATSATAGSIAVDGYWPEEALITAAIKSNGDLSLGYYHTNYSSAL